MSHLVDGARAPRRPRRVDPILRALLAATTGAVAALDAAGQIVLANGRAAALLGCSEREVVGRSVAEMLAPDNVADILGKIGDVASSGVPADGHAWVVEPDGQRTVVRYALVPIDRRRRPTGVLAVIEGPAEPHHAAAAARHSDDASRQLALRQRQSMRDLINAHEEERRAVAYDLHDGLTQYVMAAHAHLQAFREAHKAGSGERAEKELDLGLRYIREAVSESRRLVSGIASLPLHEQGLAGALEHLLAEEGTIAGWEDALLDHDLAGARFDPAIETAMYRVAQEALTNVRRHAHAGRVRVTLTHRMDGPAGVLTLEVRDWGVGFTPSERPADPSHVGLRGMVERIALLGGECRVVSAPGVGTTVAASVPGVMPAAREAEHADG